MWARSCAVSSRDFLRRIQRGDASGDARWRDAERPQHAVHARSLVIDEVFEFSLVRRGDESAVEKLFLAEIELLQHELIFLEPLGKFHTKKAAARRAMVTSSNNRKRTAGARGDFERVHSPCMLEFIGEAREVCQTKTAWMARRSAARRDFASKKTGRCRA